MAIVHIEASYRDGVVRLHSDDGTPPLEVPIDDYKADPEAYTAQKTDMAEAKREKLAELADIRWEKTQTMLYDGERINPDDAYKPLSAVVLTRQILGITRAQDWKLADGVFRSWDDAALIAFGAAINAHIQGCFANEKALTAQIAAAATSREVMAIDLTQGWPVTAA